VPSETLDVVEAEHAAYGRLPDPVTHRRRVLWVKPRYWVIVDDLLGEAEHGVELRFQFAPGDAAADSARWACARTAAGPGLLLRPFATASLTAEVATGSLAPLAGWISPAYGCRQPAPALIYRARARLPMRIATLLLPVDAAVPSHLDVRPLLGGSGELVGLRFPGDGEVLRFDEPERLVAH
jgi:Heparinase II/III-like protein